MADLDPIIDPRAQGLLQRAGASPGGNAAVSADTTGKVVSAYEPPAHEPDTTPAEPPPAPVPNAMPAISDRQFGEGLWRDGLISYDDYLAFVGQGTVPAPLKAIIDTLPDDDTGGPTPRKVAIGLLTGAQTYQFENGIVDIVREKQGWTPDELRERWLRWSDL